MLAYWEKAYTTNTTVPLLRIILDARWSRHCATSRKVYPQLGSLGFFTDLIFVSRPGPYLRTGHRGPGPGRQISRGGILKKSKLKYGMREKKGCPREINLREIYTENNVGSL
jgi:hypothetical protein